MEQAAPKTAISRQVTICNQRGLHARAAARFVKLADSFDAKIEVGRGGLSVSGSSIMGLMMLAATPGSALEIRANGVDAETAIEALATLVATGFDEN